MERENDILKTKILEFLALVGECSREEIRQLSQRKAYIDKVITSLNKDKYIRIHWNGEKNTYRLTARGKRYLEEIFPDIYCKMFIKQKESNKVRNDKRRVIRRELLTEIIVMLMQTGVKIIPSEKQRLKQNFVRTRADNTDFDCEFYTSIEIKDMIEDCKISVGSRALGVLITRSSIYIIYNTPDSDMRWSQETERKFYQNIKSVLSKTIFGYECDTYLLILSESEETAATLLQRESGRSKIYPSIELPQMLFAQTKQTRDRTIEFIVRDEQIFDKLETQFRAELVYDKKYPHMDGVRNGAYVICAFRFNLYRVRESIAMSVRTKARVMIICFDYQREYIDAVLETLEGKHNVIVLSNPIDKYIERYLE